MTAQTSLWRAVTPLSPKFETLEGDVETDVAIIGAGFTGLSTALHLAQAGKSVTVLEAEDVGFGASGRNNGQVIPVLTRADPDYLTARFGAAGERFVNLIGGSAAFLFDLVREHGLECEAEQSGWIQPAHSPGRFRAISENRYRQWEKHGADVELLDKAELERRIGTNFFFGGFGNKTGGHINPLALSRELARAAAENGAVIYERSPALSYGQHGDGWQVTTPGGAVRSRALVAATNAYTGEMAPKLAPKLARSVMPVTSWQLATVPLSDNVRRTVVPDRQAISDTHGDLHFFRYDARNRLITGGALAMPFNGHRRIRTRIAKRLQRIFPQYLEPEIEFSWTGYVGATRDHTPHFHRLGPNAWTWIGCNGRGVALSVALGGELAKAVQGVAEADLAFPLTGIEPLPLHSFLRATSRPFTLSLYRYRDWREMG
jgi:glycine/D-amino acid oxidase-like deaminating enzyme